MNDSDESLELKELRQTISQTLREYFDVRRQRGDLKIRHQKKVSSLTGEYESKDRPLAAQEAELAERLRQLVIPNWTRLATGKIKSFVLYYGRVSVRKKAETTNIIDTDGFEKQARKYRLLTKLGRFTRTWKPNKIGDILEWMKDNPDLAKAFEAFMSTEGGEEYLYVQANTAYLTEYDPNRVTEKAVNLGKAELDDDDIPTAD